MDLYKFSALANIGSFLLGCVIVYLAIKERRTGKVMGEGTLKTVTSPNPLVWVFLAGMILSGYLQFKAASIQFGGASKPQVESSSTPPEVTTKHSRTFVTPDMRMDDLRDIVKSSTQLPGEKKTTDYIGKWIKFSGLVSYIDSGQGSLYIAFQANNDDPSVDAFVSNSYSDQASTIKAGQTTELVCQIVRISSHNVRLDNCEFPEPSAH